MTCSRRGQSGMSLIELSIALVVIGVLGIAVATLSAAGANAWMTRDQYRRQIADGRIMQHRMTDLIRSARRVINFHDAGLGQYADVLLWVEDVEDEGQVNFAELAAITYDTQNHTLQLHLPDLTEAERADPLINPVVDPITAATGAYAQQFRTARHVAHYLLAENVSGLQVTLGDQPVPYCFIELRLTLSGAARDQSITQTIAAMLRAPDTQVHFGTGGGS